MSTIDAIAGEVPAGAHVGLGGVLLDRKPIAAVRAIAASGVTGLTVSTFLASLDVEVLVAGGAVRRVRTGYVGFEHRGGAPLFRSAVADGDIVVEAHSETTFTAGLRAAAAGIPFMPIRGAVGSDIETDLGLRTVDDPYGSEPVLVAPATRLDVAILHTHRADRTGAVALPPPTFLFDADVLIARAAAKVIVTAEEIVDQLDGPVLLTALDVDIVVPAPGGAAPLALPGTYPADETWIADYLAAEHPTERAMAEGRPGG